MLLRHFSNPFSNASYIFLKIQEVSESNNKTDLVTLRLEIGHSGFKNMEPDEILRISKHRVENIYNIYRNSLLSDGSCIV